MSESDWSRLPSDGADLFRKLRESGPVDAVVRFGIGTEEGFRVEVPAVRLMLQGQLRAEPDVDRLVLEVEGWGPDDFAWFGRRKGRGRTDYWQGAVEYRPEGRPALVLYFTAPADGLEIRVRPGGRKQETPRRGEG